MMPKVPACETALSQAGVRASSSAGTEAGRLGTPRASQADVPGRGSVSPGTLEMGVVTSPFHSQKMISPCKLGQ